MTKTPLQFRHNGREVALFVDGGTNLLVVLREMLGDVTPKFGCGILSSSALAAISMPGVQ